VLACGKTQTTLPERNIVNRQTHLRAIATLSGAIALALLTSAFFVLPLQCGLFRRLKTTLA